MDLVAISLNILSKLIIVLVCFDTARKEGKKRKKEWYALAVLWLIEAILVLFLEWGTPLGVYLYILIGALTIRVSDTLKSMRKWAKLIEWSGAGIIGASLCYIVIAL